MSDDNRCTAIVFKRDTYRRTGRTRSGLEMHYDEARCSRTAMRDAKCYQHQPLDSYEYVRVGSRVLKRLKRDAAPRPPTDGGKE